MLQKSQLKESWSPLRLANRRSHSRAVLVEWLWEKHIAVDLNKKAAMRLRILFVGGACSWQKGERLGQGEGVDGKYPLWSYCLPHKRRNGLQYSDRLWSRGRWEKKLKGQVHIRDTRDELKSIGRQISLCPRRKGFWSEPESEAAETEMSTTWQRAGMGSHSAASISKKEEARTLAECTILE